MTIPEVALLEQLAANSDPYRDPLAAIDWARLDPDACWLPPQAVSLHGLTEYEALSESVRIRLSQYEFLAVAQAGIALERIFLECTTRRLRRARMTQEYAYLLHEIREESGHSLMFLRLIAQSGLPAPDWAGSLPRSAQIASRLLFLEPVYWFATFMAEDVPDKLNRFVRRQEQASMCPVVRQIVTAHLVDEARHIAYARRRLEAVFRDRHGWTRALLTPVFDAIFNRFVAAYFWPRPQIYALAGLGDGATWHALARRNPHRREFVARLLAPTLRLFAGHGVNLRLR